VEGYLNVLYGMLIVRFYKKYYDTQIKFRQVQVVLKEEKPEDKQTKESGNIQFIGGRSKT
jgi:hypothetical protein